MNQYELKAKLRIDMIKKRESLEDAQMNAAILCGEKLAELVISHYHPYKVGAYWPKGREFPTQTCINTFRKAGTDIFLPVVSGDDIDFYLFTGEKNLSEGTFGVFIPPVEKKNQIAPSEIDFILVPGVAFDRHMWRLGYGKGFYDRYFMKLKPSTVKMGLAYNLQVLDKIPHSENDQPVDFIFTDTGQTLPVIR